MTTVGSEPGETPEARARSSSGGVAHLVGVAGDRLLGHWLLLLNVAVSVYLLGGLLAPLLAALRLSAPADALYRFYHLTCHQWPFRTFFLLGPQAIYDEVTLVADGLDPFQFRGDDSLGWKMAYCERDLAIYASVLLAGVLYARRQHFPKLPSLGLRGYGLLILPMALDGCTQLFGWRESTWQLRVLTGVLFGLASGWLVLPRLEAAFDRPQAESTYPATHNHACQAQPPASPIAPASPRG
jgi:uncharacterized membrane protein